MPELKRLLGISRRARLLFRNKMHSFLRRLKAPRMLQGYSDPCGETRELTRISDTVYFYRPENIAIEDSVFIWHYTILDGTAGISIGEGTQIGAWVGIFTHSSHLAIRLYGRHYQRVAEEEKIAYPKAPVVIGRFVFVGSSAIILPGVTIGDGSIIAPGTVVKKDVPAFSVVSGNPAKVVGDSEKLDEFYLASHPEVQQWYEEWRNSP